MRKEQLASTERDRVHNAIFILSFYARGDQGYAQKKGRYSDQSNADNKALKDLKAMLLNYLKQKKQHTREVKNVGIIV